MIYGTIINLAAPFRHTCSRERSNYILSFDESRWPFRCDTRFPVWRGKARDFGSYSDGGGDTLRIVMYHYGSLAPPPHDAPPHGDDHQQSAGSAAAHGAGGLLGASDGTGDDTATTTSSKGTNGGSSSPPPPPNVFSRPAAFSRGLSGFPKAIPKVVRQSSK